MQWLFYMIMQTVCVVQRLHMKDMVYWFKSGSIYSLCGSFPPFLPSLSIRWLSLAPFLIHPVNLFSFLPLAVCLHLYISFSHSLVFAPALLPSLRVSFSFLPYSFLRHFFFSSFLHLYLLWFVPSFHRIFPLFDLTSHYLSWLIDSHCSLSA